MQKTSTGVFIALIIIAVIAGAVYYTRNTGNGADQTAREEAQQEDAVTPTQTINVKHQYKDGSHIFAGVIETPTPCYVVNAILLPGDVNEIRITSTPQEDADMCAQVVTEKPFMVSHAAAEDAQFLTTVNDELVNMNQFDIDQDVDISTVEIYIKG